MFVASSFIYPYSPSDKAIRLMNNLGKVAHTVNVCTYQKAGVVGKYLKIVLEDNNKEYTLEFADANDARLALNAFKIAIDTLRPNCKLGTTPTPGNTVEPIEISYLQYKQLQATNALIAFQWYDVNDSNMDLFATGQTVRFYTKSTNDRHPRGQILPNGGYVSIDCVQDRVVTYEDTPNNNAITNGSMVGNDFLNSTYVKSVNSSKVAATNSSYITAENNSTLNVTNCFRIKATNGTNVAMENAMNVTFDNIQQDLTTLPFMLLDVNIDKNTSFGKAGVNVTGNPGGVIPLQAYSDYNEQEFTFSGNNTNIVLILDNLIVQAGAQFKIRYRGTGVGNIITVKNKINDTLFHIQDNNKNQNVVFTYSRNSQLFEFTSIEAIAAKAAKTINVTVSTIGQSVFQLNYPVTMPTELEMYVNGSRQIYGKDFVYDGSTLSVQFLNRNFNLSVGDELEFVVY